MMSTSSSTKFIESGRAELVNNLIGPFPGLVTMRLLGVPVEYYERFAHIVHRTLYVPAGSPERAEVDAGMQWIAGLFLNGSHRSVRIQRTTTCRSYPRWNLMGSV